MDFGCDQDQWEVLVQPSQITIIWCFCASPCLFWKHNIWFWVGSRADVAMVKQWTLPAFAEKVLPNRTSVWCDFSPTDMKSCSQHIWLTTKPTHCASIAWIGFFMFGLVFFSLASSVYSFLYILLSQGATLTDTHNSIFPVKIIQTEFCILE